MGYRAPALDTPLDMTTRARSRAQAAVGIALVGMSVLLFRALVDDLPTITHEAGDTEENTARISGTQTVGQTFVPPPTNVSAVELELRGSPGKPLLGTVRLHLRRAPDASLDLRMGEIQGTSIRRDTMTRFRFTPLDTRAEPSLTALVEYDGGTPDAPLIVKVERPRADGQPRTDYPGGTALENGIAIDADLAFRVLSRGRRPFGVQVAGAALMGGLALLAPLVFRRWGARAARAVLMVGLPTLFFFPMLNNPSFLGAGDWDMNTTLHAAAARAMLEERTFPGWNPYLCGGTPLAAFPEAPTASPFFGTVLLGGPLVGFKINILLHAIIGFAGMVVWLRRGFGTSWLAAFLGASVTMFSSFLTLHIVEGHTRKVAFAWIPWVFFFFQRAMGTENGERRMEKGERRDATRFLFPISHFSFPALRWAAPAGAALALMFLDGSVYLSLYTSAAVALLGVLLALQRRALLPAIAAGLTLLLAGLLAGTHLIPTAVSQATIHPVLEHTAPQPPLRSLVDVFLDPNQDAYAQKFAGQSLPWSEYGAYVGIVAVLLGGVGAVTRARAIWPWLAVGALFLAGAALPPVQHALRSLPILGTLRNPQRMVGLVVVVAGLAAALGLERIRRFVEGPNDSPRGATRLALGTLTALVIGHLLFVNTETLASAFPYQAPTPSRAGAFEQGWAPRRLIRDQDSFPFTTQNLVDNRGSVNRCSVASVRPSGNLRLPPSQARGEVGHEFADAPYAGEAYFLEGRGTAEVTALRTADATVVVTAAAPAVLALNQNYHAGWRASVSQGGGASVPALVTPTEGIISVHLPAGPSAVTFAYVPPGLTAGFLTSGVGLLMAVWVWRRT